MQWVCVLSVWCSNRITCDGARQLAELLKCDTALEVLDLSYNRIGNSGATAIATALALHNTHLKSYVHLHSVTTTAAAAINILLLSVFTVRCTLVQSAVLRSHVVRLSVCLSVCNVGGSGSHRSEIWETNCTVT